MTSETVSTTRTLSSALAMAGAQAALTGLWEVAAELSPARRRLARVGMVAGIAAGGAAFSRLRPAPDENQDLTEDEPAEATPPRLTPAMTAVGVGIGLAVTATSQLMRKHWLTGLAREHAHPERALALRMAALAFAGTLSARLLDALSYEEGSPDPTRRRGRIG